MDCETKVIDRFVDEYHFLSNFFMRKVTFGDIEYESSEHAYQTNKTDDPLERAFIRSRNSPMAAKRAGSDKKKVTLRRDWKKVSLTVMYSILYNKFSQNKDLGEKLMKTWPALLIEGNNWGDTFWGQVNGIGENWLGKLLMQVRSRLIDELEAGGKGGW